MTSPYGIVQLGAEVLRQVAGPIADATGIETQALIAALADTLAGTQGVGLAAPQVGVSKRLIIVASKPTSRYPNAPLMAPTVMINPSFRPNSNTQEKDWEGCLSIPGIRALVPRYKEITISYTDQHGANVNQQLSGFVARVFQHEYDHLEGLVYLDRIESTRDIVAESEYFRLIA